jgi:hypothetical protein
MLALHLRERYLNQLFVAPLQSKASGGNCSPSPTQLPVESAALRAQK